MRKSLVILFIVLTIATIGFAYVKAQVDIGVGGGSETVINLEPPAEIPFSNATFNESLTDTLYWKLDGTNAPPSADWDMGGFGFSDLGATTMTGDLNMNSNDIIDISGLIIGRSGNDITGTPDATFSTLLIAGINNVVDGIGIQGDWNIIGRNNFLLSSSSTGQFFYILGRNNFIDHKNDAGETSIIIGQNNNITFPTTLSGQSNNGSFIFGKGNNIFQNIAMNSSEHFIYGMDNEITNLDNVFIYGYNIVANRNKSVILGYNSEDIIINDSDIFINKDVVSLNILNNFSVDGNTLVVDDVNNRVGVGTSSPTHTLNVVGTVNVTSNTSSKGVRAKYVSIANTPLDDNIGLRYDNTEDETESIGTVISLFHRITGNIVAEMPAPPLFSFTFEDRRTGSSSSDFAFPFIIRTNRTLSGIGKPSATLGGFDVLMFVIGNTVMTSNRNYSLIYTRLRAPNVTSVTSPDDDFNIIYFDEPDGKPSGYSQDFNYLFAKLREAGIWMFTNNIIFFGDNREVRLYHDDNNVFQINASQTNFTGNVDVTYNLTVFDTLFGGRQIFSAYDSVGGTTFTDTKASLPLGTEKRKDSFYLHETTGDSNVTIKRAGDYWVEYDVTARQTVANTRRNPQCFIEVNDVIVEGTNSTIYQRTSSSNLGDRGTMHSRLILTLSLNDEVDVTCVHIAASTTSAFVQGHSRLNLEFVG